MQARLLRVLQERTFEPLGSSEPVEVDVRIIAATNKDLAKLVRKGTFRQDLYYRVNVVQLMLPELCDRREDIPLLIDRFVSKFNRLQNKDLAFFPEHSENFKYYVGAVGWAQDYARINREIMMEAVRGAIVEVIKKFPKDVDDGQGAVNCHHNYVEMENHFGKNVWVTRKGAVRARVGDMGIIPGSMGERSFIVRGKGNADSFNSCSHGAGRLMSRTQARKTFTVEDHIKATEGVNCRKDVGVIDETKGCYKNIDDVMASQTELVDIVHTLKQFVCVKG